MGHNEEPAPYVASTGFERAEQARFDCKAQLTKFPEDGVGSQRHMSFDVFEEAPFGVEFSDNATDMGPEMARIFLASTPAGKAEWLAGISASEDMNLAAPRAAVEGGNVTPERRFIQGLVFHPCHESGRREGFPFDVTNSAISGFCDVQAEFETSDASAEGDAVEGIISGGM